jgi:hypothetical protein
VRNRALAHYVIKSKNERVKTKTKKNAREMSDGPHSSISFITIELPDWKNATLTRSLA